jgi:hypothetical protein
MDTLLRLLPPIRRTRGPRLYAADGRRFLDLWLDDGRDILGAAGRSIRTYAANASDKGLLHPYPGLYEQRLEKAVLAAWPAFKAVRFYLNEERALAAAARLSGRKADTLELIEAINPDTFRSASGGLPGSSDGGLVKLRPFRAGPSGLQSGSGKAPLPPPFGTCLPPGSTGSWLESEVGDLVPAMMHYAAARAMASYAKVSQDGSYGEELWKRFDRRMAPYFRRSGPYLLPNTEAGNYVDFFDAALEGGALVSPTVRRAIDGSTGIR